ncbi:hypothetical protein ASPCADRAFT_1597 [Aspergillus carbonarius ITEM 5010]|uniref:Uncharacterized protein n=1 Tax=Aspergillus carbonarius (strain ITEM 5010) TaxID=602072 RepID=A0A1R3RZQ6_ASPC5|nr:hypothetical protein ASPCADRAFT_1597 [Aspergillus carbonarius ITEM 5010]
MPVEPGKDDEDVFLGVLLPSSLECLSILDVDRDNASRPVAHLIQLVCERDIHVPHLNSITLEIDLERLSNDAIDQAKGEKIVLLETACADHGMRLNREAIRISLE